MNRSISSIALVLAVIGASQAATFVASPTGTAAAAGSTVAAPTSAAKAFAAASAGDSVVLLAGTYSIPFVPGAKNTIALSAKGTSSAPISVVARGGRAVFDFSFPEETYVQDSYGLLVSGAWWSFRGIDVTRAGYQGVYVTGSHNTFVNCAFHDNRNSGMEINKGGEYTTVIDCDSYRNYDPKKTGTMSDGFASKQLQGPGNTFHGCRAWENSDDGWDLFDSPEIVTIDSCMAFRNGYHKGVAVGNGNGFKLGGNNVAARNVARHCISFQNLARGFDQNNNKGGIVLVNNTSYRNGTNNFDLNTTALDAGEEHLLVNNISVSPGAADIFANDSESHNSWNKGFSVSSADFQSLDTTLATAERDSSGGLAPTNFLRLKATSVLVDAGIAAGTGFLGSAPDLGALETPKTTSLERGGAPKRAPEGGIRIHARGEGWNAMGRSIAGHYGEWAIVCSVCR